MYTHLLLLALAGSAEPREPTCPEVLVPVCDELAADRPLAAAELAAPVARDAAVAPRDRRAAATIAVGAWVKEGSPAARCKARALLADYFADPTLPRTPALERRRDELAADRCDSTLAPTSAATPPVAPPPSKTPAPPPSPTVVSERVKIPVGPPTAPRRDGKTRRVVGGALIGVGVGFAAATLGAVIVMGRSLEAADDIGDQARLDRRELTELEAQQFRSAFARAEGARWVALGVGVAGAATLGAGIPLLVSGRRAARLGVHVRGGAVGLILTGAF